ncbi:nebulin isoform X31 [Pipistrellus kuhlii]|uniref:nebulin isoform X31 n=1 Tax=Pipistrellus kuhlii TaxID=59472 RepID=UPI001E271AE2|nr:nebulin isoform X31 [Pipistrellus kuhlii]
MADEEEYEEVVEYYTEETVYEEVPGETITEIYETTTTKTISDYEQSQPSKPGLALPEPGKPAERKKVIRKKVDSSKFMTPYIAHSRKMQDLFSINKYKENYEKGKGQPSTITTDTPEHRRIKKVQDQLSEVKYRMDGDIAKTICHVDEKARDIEHAKKVSQQVSKVLYKQNWEDNKDKYLLPPDAPELVHAIKNTALFSKKLYTEEWDADKSLFYPYNDSPELRRVAQAQKALSDISYKKGHIEQQTHFTSLADPPDIIFAKKVNDQASKLKYKQDYENKVKGKWSETPCFEIAAARTNAENFSTRKYHEKFENMKDQIYFMQTETPEYKMNKQAGVAASKVKYKENYEKDKGKADYNVLPASENPLLRQMMAAGNTLSDKRYKENYEKTKARSINYCETPKFQLDSVLKKFSSDTQYRDSYLKNILGHYVGSYEDPYYAHCMKVTAQNSDKNYRADYEEDRGKGFFPQTITQEYETMKKLDQCKDHTYRVHPDKTKFTQVTDSPVQLQAQINAKQLSDLNYKAKHESEKFKCHIPPDTPAFIQHRVNAYNLSDNVYKHDWEKTKAKKFDIKVDAIPLLAAKANSKNASEVMYKKDYEKNRGKMIGALSINDDPKMLHSLKTGKMQSDRLYKENYEKTKAKSMNYCETPKYQLDTLLKSFSETKYKDKYVQNILGHYIGSFEDPYETHCMKVSAQNSEKNYKAEYEEDRGKCYFPQTITQEYEAIKKLDQCKDHAYKLHPDKTKFTAVTDTPVLLQAQLNTKQLSDLNYKAKHEGEKFKCHVPADAPQFIQHRVNAYNLSDNVYKHDWEKTKAKKFDIKVDAIPLLAAKANSKNASEVMYKKDYEKNRGKMIGALSINDDPKMLHSLKTAKMQSDREYHKDYEKSKTIYTAPLDMLQVTQAKKAQAIASDMDYRNVPHSYSYPPDSINLDLAKKAYALQSDVEYKADYNSWMKGCGWVPYGSLEVEKAKRASDILNEKKYRQHPDTLKFTSIEDAPITVQSKINQAQRSDIVYKAKGEETLHKYSLPADLPQFIQAKVNAYNISENMYKADLKDMSKKGYDLRTDAIPIKAAKAARQAASDVQYKKDYEKAKGKMVGFQSLQDDPKLVHYMNVAKIQSDRIYKNDYEKTKTKFNIPHDMFNVVAAKKAQDIVSNTNYKHPLHHYTYLPDAMDLELSKNMMQIQSNNVYKEDYNTWMKGIGWIPIGSLDVEKVKKAGDALSEKKYRQHPDTLKFTSIVDSPVMVQAKQNTQQVSDILYKAKGEDVKHKYTMSADLPQFLQAKCNAYNISDVCYKRDWHDLIAKGNNVLGDAIPITAAKASRNIASDYKYKEAYEKAKGKHVGFRSLQDDPKLVHYMNVAKLQSDREYRKNYENTKTSYHTPGDMVSITAAKMAQDVVTNVNYKQPIHHYTYLPDAMSVQHTRNANQIQSDNVYKDDYNTFFKGIGWIPIGSLEVEKAKKAGEALNERKYRQHPDTIKFTSVPDSMGMVLAQHNTKQLSDLNYKVEGEKLKHKYTIDPELPQFIQAKVNALNMSDAYYKADWKKTLAKGYDLRTDAIPIVAAKSSRNIASDFKYKEAHEKAKGKQIGFRSLQDDPKLVHYMNVAKMQSDREYRKGYEASKTRYHTPLDMFSVTAAKKSQEVATNTNYRQPYHNYTLLPDAMNVEHSKNAMQIQSDNLYKSDFTNWMKGIGWVPIDSLEVEKAKKAGEILSEKKYRQHPEKLKFTYSMDTMEQELNKNNKLTMDKRRYIEKWNKDKTTIHVMPDTPDILLSKMNQITMSDKLYKAGWEEEKKKGYDLRPDAISIKAAKASRDIASDFKYKQAYEQGKGKHIGFRSLEDDPKLVHFMQVAKMQSDREYRKGYEKSKTSFHTPVDMFSVVAAKKSQEVATNANYRNVIHTYNLLPDAMSFELAKNMMQIQSNNQYKADFDDFVKGVGWLPLGSLEAEKNKKAMEIISEKKYRQHPDTLKYSTLMDSMNMVLAQNNAKIMNEHLYKQAWEADKTKVHIMPDIPQIVLAKANAVNMSDKLYKLSMEESKKKGYDLRTDAISIKAAKASRDIASDYKYKYNYEKERGKMVGFRSLEDDPKLVHSMQVAKMQSDREYKKNYEKTKTSYHTPPNMLSVMAAKDAQANITNTNYKHLIHKYILLPDAMHIQLSKNMNHIQSDNEYKQDYNEWYKGLGWSPAGSLEVEKAKKATEYASDQKYRQHPSTFQFKKLTDSMDMVLAKQNALTMNKHLYTVDWNKDKTKIHLMPDTPDILQAKQNQAIYSQKLYKLGWEEALKKGYDLPVDAISVQLAKSSRDIASDFKYKQGYRKQLGHHIGFRSLQDDPKLVLSMNVAKMQSDREYKKDFEKWKTKYTSPVDMLGVVLAKKCQALVSDVDYKNYLHQWTCLPDQNDVIQAKKVYEIQSENLYKSDLEWLRGIGWSPLGSLEAEKNKRASEIISEKKYRQPADKNKFTSIPDAMDIVLAKANAKNRSDRLYREAWDKDKTQVHIMPDTPDIILAKANLINTSDKLYRMGYEELKKKGYDLPLDAISVKAAKASREIASEYKYKEGFRKQLGHHIGARDIKDDPKMMWSMHVAKIQSDREYKKDFEKSKTRFSSPVDMLGVVLAKKCQTLVSDVDYKNYLHQWTCLPDQNDVIHARQAYDIQSDNLYKADLQWLKGIGWLPSGSLEDEKNKRAMQILSEHVYRQHPDKFKFTSLMDSMPMVLAKNNAITMNHRLYTEAWDKDKTSIHIMPDTPEVLLAKQNKINYSEKLYKLGLEEAKKKGYDMRLDAIPIRAAKASRDIASEFKYKEGYRKQLGHHIGARNIKDDPKMMWSMHVAKIQSDREYKKDFEKWKTKYSSPVDMLGVVLAKKCQTLVSDVDYKNYLHQWTCLPDQNDVIHARQAYEIQSDNMYKSDLQWMRGIGWVPIGSLDVEKCKRATEILSDKIYRQHPDQFRFTSVTDSLEQVLAKNNAITMNKRLYTEAWDKDKTQIHIMPDTPEITLARMNKINYSESLYKLANEEAKKKGYDLRVDAIPIVAAKASRDIASDYKYKDGYRKQLGHHIGARDIKDDPKMMWSMHVAKIQSDREYKKDFEKSKTRFSSPVDMLGVVLAKKCQTLVSDVDYKNYLHQWTCLPDQNDVIHARQAYEIQSDNMYKSDLQWMRGIGWVPIGSLDVVKCKRAAEILSDNLYRQPPDKQKFTSVTDSLEQVLAKNNAITMNKRLYTEAWDKDKTQIHIMPDTPEIMLARQNKINYSESLYRQAMEEAKKEGYDLRSDAISIVAAKASRDIASDYKYKEAYRKQLGHHIGARAIHDDPKMMWSLHIAKVLSSREYKKEFEKYKTRYSSPVDMLGIVLAKKCQTLVSDVDYKHLLHEWTCLPDQNDVIHARKAYDLQSDNLYKADLEWMKGIGWVPIGSLEVVKAKRATEILSDNIYRQRPDTLKFTSITDTPEQVLAKSNAINMNKRLYTEAWDNDKKTIHVMPDTPEIMLAKLNRINYSDKLYKLALEESRKEGYDLRVDAIPIQAAKASRDIASEYKYKEGYRKQLGHHIGARNIKDDPKMMWSMHVAKIQSDREYKKDFEKSKTRFSSPVDMLGVVLAKKCQILVSDIDYKHPLHEWTCLPDQNDVIQARKAYDLQSDAIYKADLEWLRGIGWVPIGSVEVEKVKRAGEILSDRKYRLPADKLKFTCITDTPEIVLAKSNALTMSKHLYTEAWDADKTSIHVMPDTPEILLAKSNSVNISQKLYTKGWDESKMKDYDLRADAISIKSAKASRDIASDYKYKEAYEKQKGHHIGAQSIEDDPKIMCAINAGKIQSEREYKKDFEKFKTKFSSPVDMLGILLAKKCQTLVSDIDYRNILHHWTCLPDQNDIIQAKRAYELQSDSVYKADLEWLRGIGWMPEGSVEMTRVKGAQDLVNERLYRTRPDALKFTCITDTPEVVLAKANSLQISEKLYQEAWNKDKTNISIPSDTPVMLQAQLNALQISNKLYQKDWNEAKQKGYDIRADAIEIKHAKASREIASEYKYKEGYRKQLGHHVGFRSLQDDPKLVWSIHAAKIQSDREYRKAYEKSKGIYNTPLDMMSIVQAKKCQVLVSDVDYRNYLHQWTCLPDQNDVIQAKKAYELQSDNVYKSDLEWLKGIGWLTEGSVDVVRVKNAQDLLNEKLYRTKPESLKFTSIVDTPEVVLAKTNALQISEPLYREAWDKEKTNVNVPADTPAMLQSKINALQISNKHYQQAWEDVKMTGYDLRADAIGIQHAKASRDIASDYLYKNAYEKQKGHYIGCGNAKEDPKLVWAANVLKMQNDRLYKKAYNDHKAKISIPGDMVSISAAKEGQALASNVDYRQYLHQWSCFPDQNDVIHARNAYDLQSDVIYKADLEWLRGIGWMPDGSPEVLRVKNAQEILRDSVYRTPVVNLKYTSIVDTPEVVLAKSNAENISIPKYREVWDKDKTSIHIMPDTPEINLARANALNVSNKIYREGWDEMKMSCDVRLDAIPIQSAKASREIASDYKYKLDHEKQKGHYVGTLTAKDDNRIRWALIAGKLQNEREYRLSWAKWKTKFQSPVDMLSILHSKNCQTLVSDIDYRQRLHQWTCLPDQNDVIQAKKAYELQSDAIYKADLEWLRGIGWMPNDSVSVNHAKYAGDIFSENKYRTKIESLNFTPVDDRVDYVTAKQSGEILNDIKYRKDWNDTKSKYTLTETPLLHTAQEAARILDQYLYKEGWEKQKATGYILPPDAVPFVHAHHSSDVQSELKYKAEHVKQKGHYVGVPTMRDDPHLVWFEHAGQIQNDRLYKEDYHKTKAKINIPADTVSVLAAKQGQTLISDIDYRNYLHQWTCLPDQNDVIQAKKAYELQSDNVYKADLEWLRGIGWIPLDSVEHVRVTNNQEMVNQVKYKKAALDNYPNFTSVEDTPEIVLAKFNSVNQSDIKYKETFNKLIKGKYIFSPETPYITHSKDMGKLYSTILYKGAWEGTKAYGYTLDERYIPIVGAKHADYVNSELKYKETFEKQKGHYLAGKEISEFPSVVHCLDFQKMRSALNYRKHYEDTKANVHIPNDMMNHVLAKKCQYILSDLEYRHYFHQWTSLPEEPSVVLARNAQEILSDNVYKDDLNWLKGIGCYVWDTPQILQAKKSYDLQSQIQYSAASKDNLQNYSLVTDTPVYVTAVQSGINASEVRYKENYHQTKDKYTTILETVDYDRTKNLKDLYSNNLYKEAWEKVKATSYILPSTAMSLTHAKNQKDLSSNIKYREEYEKFKALYTLPRSVDDDPNTARCLRVGKYNIDRLYKSVYEKNKMKINIVPDMVELVTAKDTQKKVSEIDYRLHLHEWICHPDLQVNSHVRKVTDQISDIVYKDDLNWLKGIGCYVWDTPEILHAKHAYDLRNDIKYQAHVKKTRNDYNLVMDTPVYVQAVQSRKQISDAVYHYDYVHSVRGKVAPTTKTVDLDRALHAYKLQSENLYRDAGKRSLATGYRLPVDTPHFKHSKDTQYMSSYFKYKEVYEHLKANGYTLGPNDVPFVNVRRVNNVTSERLYRQLYHKLKDKIHTTPDTPELRQVKKTQEAVSELIYKSDFFKMQGHMISLPYTPQVLHCRYVGDITSDIKYKEDLQVLKGIGCFLMDTPDMVRSRHLRKLWSNYLYTDNARKMRDKYKVVLDTPEYRTVQELKTHLSELVYRAKGKKQKSIFTSIPDTPDLLRAKQGQKLQSQYLYVELATKERPHHHAGNQTTALKHAKDVKDLVSENKYKTQYEKMKDKYTPIPDTPVLIRAKKAYWNASDLRYKETFEKTKGKYHTVKDALDIVYHRRVTDDISKVKYKENYMSQLGIWRSIPDSPEQFHHRAVADAVSDVKYKEDLTWLKGIGCYAYDTPDFTLAGQNKTLYSKYKYKEIFERTKSHFKYENDCPINRHFKYATQLANEKKYRADYEQRKDKYHLVVDEPRHLLAKIAGDQISQIKYRKKYEKTKDKFTSIVDTPEHLRTTKVNKQISDILYKLEYNKAKPRGYTTIHDTPMLLHVRKVKDEVSDLKYKEVYQRNKSNCTIKPDAVHIKAAKDAYKVNTNLDYKKLYEANKAHWRWIPDRPDFLQAAKSSLQQSDFEYKLDREFLKGCKLSVTDDKDMVLALRNSLIESDLKYKEKHVKERGSCHAVPDTPQILLAKAVSNLVSENKYKDYVKKHLAQGSYTTLPETPNTIRVKEVTKHVSDTNYKKKFVKEKGKSNYSIMLEPPDVKHAMEVAKKQSDVAYRKDAKENLHYTTVADRPDIKKATQAAKQASEVEYRAKHRKEGSHGLSMLGRPDIEMAKKAAKLSSQADYLKGQRRGHGHGAASYDTPMMRHLKKVNALMSDVKYRENFDKEKGKTPKYNPKDSQLYKVMKDANNLASEVKYKADLKKLHKPVTDMKESLIMNHVLNTSQLASSYQYKKKYEKSKGHYHTIPDNLEQLHLKEATELQSIVKYKEKYEKERGKPMLDFETPTYITAKESQQMQSGKEYRKEYDESIKGRNLTGLEVTPASLHAKYATKIISEKEYRRDLEESIRGKGLHEMEDTPDMLRAKNATQILNEKEYKRDLELGVKGKGLNAMANETPDFMRAKNATDIASQIKYKHSAEMEKANFTSVVDTPEIIHAQQVKNLSSQKKYKEDAEKSMSSYETVLDTPEMQRVRENQKNFSLLQYQCDLKNSKGKITVVQDTPEILRVKENQKNFSSVLYKEDLLPGTAIGKTPEMMRVKQTQDHISSVKYKEAIGQGTPIPDLPEVKRVKETQKHISSVMYKENLGTGIPTSVTPEIERVKRNQENFSSVLYKENLGTGTPTPITPEMERVKRNQENVSSILYKENLNKGTPIPVTPEMERVKRNQENFSSVLYKENLGKGIPIPITPEMERVKHNQENFSSVLYKENVGTGIPVSITPEMQRVKQNQENISSVLYKESMGKGTPLPVTPEMERVKHNQENISTVLYKENMGKATPTPVTPEMQRVKRNQENISSVLYKDNLGKATPTPFTPEMERVKRNQENFSSVLYKENMRKATPTPVTPEMERAKRNQENISSVLYSDSFRKQIQGKAAYVLDTPEMRRVRETQRHISTVKYHEDFEKHKGCFTPVVTDPITERVKKNTQDFSDINYRGIQRKVVQMEQKRNDQDQETITGLRVWRTNPGSVFDYDPAEDNIQSRSLHMINAQAQRRSREQSRSASALSISGGEEKSEHSEGAHLSTYSNGGIFFSATSTAYKHAKTTELPQQRSSSVATQQTTVSSIPSHPSTAGKIFRAMYDYMAADADEVSFKDGDAIVNVQAIDEGWMYGTVQRTGRTGMLPANYVEAI